MLSRVGRTSMYISVFKFAASRYLEEQQGVSQKSARGEESVKSSPSFRPTIPFSRVCICNLDMIPLQRC